MEDQDGLVSLLVGFEQAKLSIDAAKGVLKDGGKIVFVGISGSTADYEMGQKLTTQEKINWGETYVHELEAHTADKFMGDVFTGPEDHALYHNYNESTEEWYGNNGYSRENYEENYSPNTYHPTSKAAKNLSRLNIIIDRKKYSPEITSPVNNTGPVATQ